MKITSSENLKRHDTCTANYFWTFRKVYHVIYSKSLTLKTPSFVFKCQRAYYPQETWMLLMKCTEDILRTSSPKKTSKLYIWFCTTIRLHKKNWFLKYKQVSLLYIRQIWKTEYLAVDKFSVLLHSPEFFSQD